ncbi:ComEC/Rec2 family competence protein [Candidatus Babeliales bacterium]|nr:ComEC/Rec2 family competence protein [Candidatus Babeliales bacterium]
MGDQKIFFIGLCFWLYVLGILCFFSRISFLLYFCIAISFCIALYAIVHRQYRYSFMIGSFLAGMLVMQVHEHMRQEYSLLISQAESIEGRIVETSKVQEKPWLSVHTIVVDTVDNQHLYFTGKIKCTIARSSGYQLYDVVSIYKKRQKKRSNKKVFDLFLAKEGLWGWLFVDVDSMQKIDHINSWAGSYFLLIKERVRSLYHQLSEPAKTLYGSIFLGIDRVLPSDDLKRSFNQWGIVHYLARSGLHIMIFVFVWKMIFYYLFGIRRSWFYFVFPFVAIYASCTPNSISFMRGVWSFLFLIGALLLKRPYHLPHLLVCLAIIFLTCNPYSLFFLDFQLSFGLTYTLLCLQEAYYTAYVQNKIKKK